MRSTWSQGHFSKSLASLGVTCPLNLRGHRELDGRLSPSAKRKVNRGPCFLFFQRKVHGQQDRGLAQKMSNWLNKRWKTHRLLPFKWPRGPDSQLVLTVKKLMFGYLHALIKHPAGKYREKYDWNNKKDKLNFKTWQTIIQGLYRLPIASCICVTDIPAETTTATQI